MAMRIRSVTMRLYIESNKSDYIEAFELGEYNENETLEEFYERINKRCSAVIEEYSK